MNETGIFIIVSMEEILIEISAQVLKTILLSFFFLQNSNSGTYINCNKILVGRNNFVVLNHGDLISFGSEKNMKLIFKFIYNQKLSNAGKKPR